MKSFCIVGLSQFGKTLARTLAREGAQVMIVDERADEVNELADTVTDAVIGDPTSQQFLDASGAADYDCAVVCLSGGIDESLLATLALKDIGVKEVIARAGSDEHRRILEKIGADSVVFPERDAANKLGFAMARENVTDFVDFSDEYSIIPITLPHSWIGKSLTQLNIRRRYNVTMVAIKKAGSEKAEINLDPDRPFEPGDILTLLGSNEDTVKLAEVK